MYLSLNLRTPTLILLLTIIPLLAVVGSVTAEDAKSYIDDRTFMETMLDTTNQARLAHNASVVSWNKTLAEFAEEVVKGCEFEHSVSCLFSISTFEREVGGG
jgi:hypothetical protein